MKENKITRCPPPDIGRLPEQVHSRDMLNPTSFRHKEIPKDGQSYICWHKDNGHGFAHWLFDEKCYVIYTKGGWYFTDDRFDRWMDEMGVWHEIAPKNTDCTK